MSSTLDERTLCKMCSIDNIRYGQDPVDFHHKQRIDHRIRQ